MIPALATFSPTLTLILAFAGSIKITSPLLKKPNLLPAFRRLKFSKEIPLLRGPAMMRIANLLSKFLQINKEGKQQLLIN